MYHTWDPSWPVSWNYQNQEQPVYNNNAYYSYQYYQMYNNGNNFGAPGYQVSYFQSSYVVNGAPYGSPNSSHYQPGNYGFAEPGTDPPNNSTPAAEVSNLTSGQCIPSEQIKANASAERKEQNRGINLTNCIEVAVRNETNFVSNSPLRPTNSSSQWNGNHVSRTSEDNASSEVKRDKQTDCPNRSFYQRYGETKHENRPVRDIKSKSINERRNSYVGTTSKTTHITGADASTKKDVHPKCKKSEEVNDSVPHSKKPDVAKQSSNLITGEKSSKVPLKSSASVEEHRKDKQLKAESTNKSKKGQEKIKVTEKKGKESITNKTPISRMERSELATSRKGSESKVYSNTSDTQKHVRNSVESSKNSVETTDSEEDSDIRPRSFQLNRYVVYSSDDEVDDSSATVTKFMSDPSGDSDSAETVIRENETNYTDLVGSDSAETVIFSNPKSKNSCDDSARRRKHKERRRRKELCKSNKQKKLRHKKKLNKDIFVFSPPRKAPWKDLADLQMKKYNISEKITKAKIWKINGYIEYCPKCSTPLPSDTVSVNISTGNVTVVCRNCDLTVVMRTVFNVQKCCFRCYYRSRDCCCK